ncbi:glycosyl transferase family 1 [Mycobacterium sp. IEC1808]|uniref:glycosyltransferase n=1 Tax=Mycobacterium sp. IEC1808 TaxID=1743230 RepID=UPI000A160C89|nr:glycosyltransferase [Mycobacterium sp. IEC1808]ORW91597.1 glycosyl transferase family 1 [Mycobacterium sp. IEC1808]
MKVAIVCGDDLVGDDPAQLRAALVSRGHEATVYARGQGPIQVGPGAPAPAAEVLPYVGDWAQALVHLWSADRPDVVHAYGWLGGLAAQLAARRHRIPTVQSFQGLAVTSRSNGAAAQRGRERIEPLLARGATWVTGECTTDVDVLSRLRHSRVRVSSLCSGVDVERYSPVGTAAARNGRLRILCMAPDPLLGNGFDVVIRALPKIVGAELVIAETAASEPAHDRARAQLERFAAESGVDDRVRFAGTVGDDELPSLLRSADVVACTPRQPPRATPVLQAMASGVAVVAVPVGVLTDAVVDGVTGLVLAQRSPAAVASALRNLLAQSFQCDSMGAAGRSRAVSRFSWDRIALDAQHIYRQLASQPSGPAAVVVDGATARRAAARS